MVSEGAKKSTKTRLTVSLLCFYAEEMTLRHLRSTTTLLSSASHALNVDPLMIVRSNTPDLESAEFDHALDHIRKSASFPILHERSPRNLGFGGGHNLNFRMHPGDIFWALNNDVNFSDLNWLSTVFDAFHDDGVSLVGPANSLTTLSPHTAAGRAKHFPWQRDLYAEGSSLFIRSKHFIGTDIFDESFRYAYYEDADLSLRAAARGLRISFVDMPHQHLRSASASLIPVSTRRSVTEENRTRFLARWQGALDREQVSGSILIDLESAQASHAIAALGPTARLYREALSNGSTVHIKIGRPELAGLLGKIAPKAILRTPDSPPGLHSYDRVASLDGLNFSAPFHLEDLIAAAFGVPEPDEPLDLREALGLGERSDHGPKKRAVVQFDSPQADFEGIEIDQSAQAGVLDHLISRGMDVAVLGRAEAKTSLDPLFSLIAGADVFIGIDSEGLRVAQALGIPTFGIFGATSPLTRMRMGPRNAAFTHPDLACLGCYHDLIEPASNWCMRRDQACVSNLPLHSLLQALDAFMTGEAMDWSGPFASLETLRRRWLMSQIFNPSFRNRLISYEGEAGRIPDMLVQILGILEEQSRISLRRSAESALHAMYREVVERGRQIDSLMASLERDPPGDPGFGNIILDDEHATFADCTIRRHGEGLVLDCKGPDPQIYLRQPISSGPSGLNARFRLSTEATGEFQIFYRDDKSPSFDENRSVKAFLRKGANLLEMHIPIIDSEIMLRIDPLNAPGTITLHKAEIST